jgi:UDP-GlcNAc:undecaprenyl-phosphate GlcNAc-1-phosphate transferase
MNKFLLSEKDLIKLSIMMLLAVGFFGLKGLVAMILMQWVTRQSFAADAVDKHGIAEVPASRLGGVMILIGSTAMILLAVISGAETRTGAPFGIPIYAWVGMSGCALMGLVEDIRNDTLKPRYRLLGKVLVFLVVFIGWPELVPSEIGIVGLDSLLAYRGSALLLTIIFCVGFLNSANMADGANGLMPGIFFAAFLIFYLEYGGLGFQALMTGCGLFLIFNVISGRLFLGDAGAYGLASGVALAGLFFYKQGIFSAPSLAVLLAYPCIEILVSMARRALIGRSVFLPDNDHLHNRVHQFFKRQFKSANMANSLTGLSIAGATAGVALVGYLGAWWPVTGNEWLGVFIGQCAIYGVVFTQAGSPISDIESAAVVQSD